MGSLLNRKCTEGGLTNKRSETDQVDLRTNETPKQKIMERGHKLMFFKEKNGFRTDLKVI